MGLLVALTVGAGIAVAVMPLGVPGLSVPPAAAAPAAAAPATATEPLSTRGVVVASASCTDPGARDLVELRGAAGRPQKVSLDACGTPVGSIVPLTLADGDTVAHLAGTGSRAGAAPDRSPMVERMAVALGAVAALGVAALLAALGRRRWSGRRPVAWVTPASSS